MAGEQLCAVPPLPASDDDAAAVQLFVERARAVAPRFQPDHAELAVILDIVRRLDGLPLAIELAAARLHTLDVAEVGAGLDHRFDLLSTGYRTSPRHGSLGAAMSWSFGLLDRRLQQIFEDLSVFTASFSLADATAVCGVDAEAAASALDQLVERSLIMRTPDRRYVLLETLRAFGVEQLAADGRLDRAGERHALHQLSSIEAADRRLVEPGPTALTEIDIALADVRSALGWLLDHDQTELAGRLVIALLDFGLLRLRPDVLAWAERVNEADPEDRSPVAPMVWAVSAYAAWMSGDVAESGVRCRRALRACERAGRDVPAVVATMCGNSALFEGRLDDSITWYRRAVELVADDPGQHLLAGSTKLLALAYAGDTDAADAAAQVIAEVGDACSPTPPMRGSAPARRNSPADSRARRGALGSGARAGRADPRVVRGRGRRSIEDVDRSPSG